MARDLETRMSPPVYLFGWLPLPGTLTSVGDGQGGPVCGGPDSRIGAAAVIGHLAARRVPAPNQSAGVGTWAAPIAADALPSEK